MLGLFSRTESVEESRGRQILLIARCSGRCALSCPTVHEFLDGSWPHGVDVGFREVAGQLQLRASQRLTRGGSRGSITV